MSTRPNTPPKDLVLDFGTRAHAAPEEAMPAENALDNGEETETTDSSNRRGSLIMTERMANFP